MNELKDMLENHDWYYDYSDDFSVYVSGQRSFRLIKEKVEELDTDDAKELFQQYCKKYNIRC